MAIGSWVVKFWRVEHEGWRYLKSLNEWGEQVESTDDLDQAVKCGRGQAEYLARTLMAQGYAQGAKYLMVRDARQIEQGETRGKR